MCSNVVNTSELFPLKNGLAIAEFVTYTVEANICRRCKKILANGSGEQQLLHVMETCVNSPRSLHAHCIMAIHAILCRLDSSEKPKRDLDAICDQAMLALAPAWEEYNEKLKDGRMEDKEWQEFDSNTPVADFAREKPPPHLRKATKVVPKSHHYRLAYCMMLGLETAVRTEDGMRLVNSCVYGFKAFQDELEHQMRLLGFEPPYPLSHTLNLDRELDGTEIALEAAHCVLAATAFKYNIPAEGTLVSPTHVLDGQHVWFEDMCPAIFSQIRQASSVEGSEYAWSVAHRGFKFVEFVTNSKSGETFFFSHDGRFIVKTISDEEAAVLTSMLPGYLEHLKAGQSLLMRICGLYRVASEGTVGRGTRYFIVCLSVFDCGGLGLHKQFDLKGSWKGRKAKEGQTVLKDQDWAAGAPEGGLELPAEEKERLVAALARDAKFLESNGVLDYSVLIGIHDREDGGEGVLCRGVHLLSAIVKQKMLPALRTIRIMRRAVTLGGGGGAAATEAVRAKVGAEGGGSAGGGESRGAAARESGGGAGASEHAAGAAANEGHARSGGHRRGSTVRHATGSPLAKFGGGEGARYVYFLGIVDFLVPWSLKKKAEFAWNAVRGHRTTGSCVPPESYARRFVRFMAAKVFGVRASGGVEGGAGVEAVSRAAHAGGDGDTAGRAGGSPRRRPGFTGWVRACFGWQAPERRADLRQPLMPQL